jgi:hypothetical protein
VIARQTVLGASIGLLASGCADPSVASSRRLEPQNKCLSVRENPDPVKQRGFIVMYKEGIDPVATTTSYAKKYSFTPRIVYTRAIRGFAADFTPKVLAGIRCEPEVLLIEPDTPQDIKDVLTQRSVSRPSLTAR